MILIFRTLYLLVLVKYLQLLLYIFLTVSYGQNEFSEGPYGINYFDTAGTFSVPDLNISIQGDVNIDDIIKRSKESYIVYNEGYEVIAEKIRKYFLDNGITLIGRFGYFEYVNVDMALDRVVNIISKKYDQNRKDLFNLALNKISKSNTYDNS